MASKRRSHREEESDSDSDYDPVKSLTKPFERIWSEENELVVLNGVIEFSVVKGIDFASNMEDFFAFMKQSLVGTFTKIQLASKLKKLRMKFKHNLTQKKAMSGLHEKKIFELSTKISGASSTLYSVTESCSFNVLREGMHRLGKTEREKLDRKWRQIEISELEICMKRAQLLQYQIGTTFQVFSSAPVERSTRLRIIGEGMDLVAKTNEAEFKKKRKEIVILQLKLNMKKAQLVQKQIKMVLAAYRSCSLGGQK